MNDIVTKGSFYMKLQRCKSQQYSVEFFEMKLGQ